MLVRRIVMIALTLSCIYAPVAGEPIVKQITLKSDEGDERKRDTGLALLCFAASAGMAYYSLQQFALDSEADNNQTNCVIDGGDIASCERQYPNEKYYLKGALAAAGSGIMFGFGLKAWSGKAEKANLGKSLMIGVRSVRRGAVAAAQLRF